MRPNVTLVAVVLVLIGVFAWNLARTPATVASPPTATRPGPKETIVIVHGAYGGGWAWREVDRMLTADGYKVYRPTLTGLGERDHLATPDINLSLHIQDIVNVIRYEDLHDIILVGHSYGGMVITGVADRIPDRIKRRIYIDALLPVDGECLDDILPIDNQPKADGYLHPFWKTPADPPHDVNQPAKTFTEAISLKNPDLAKVPATYILTVDAGKQPKDDRFYPCYKRAQEFKWPALTMECDHNPQITHQKEIVKLLEENGR